jgi:acrylyl-CoA reductase (NADPH)/3-hydroxypropionyl-CoA dehydratase/3-hydroxypropionyl-CoA synthetase
VAPLPTAYALRRELTAQWEAPDPQMAELLEKALQNPLITRLTNQAQWAGRSKAIERITDALRAGFTRGLMAGLEREARLFAEAVVAPDEGKIGIQDFLDKRSAPLPTRRRIHLTPDEEKRMIDAGMLLPIGTPFFPGVTPIPVAQYAMAARAR